MYVSDWTPYRGRSCTEISTCDETMAPCDTLRVHRAECHTRPRLANMTRPSSDRGGVPHRFRLTSYANPSEFRTREISQRGSQPSVVPVAFQSPPPLPALERVGARQNSLHATHLAHTRQRSSSQTDLGLRSPIWRTYAKREIPGRKCPNEGWGGTIGTRHVDRGCITGISYVCDLLAIGRPGRRGLSIRTLREASLLEAVHIDLDNGAVTFAGRVVA